MVLVKENKGVARILKAQSIDMGGFPVKQALPLEDVSMVDPFLLLHHGSVKFSKDQKALHQGVGPHPHRGFSPVTFVVNGELHHRDSQGNDQVARAGEVQWMSAGAGIIHSERPSQKVVNEGMTQEFVQLWINTPSAFKMKPPAYYFLKKEEIPVLVSDDKMVRTKVIAGEWEGILQSKIETHSEMIILWSQASKNGFETIELPLNHHKMIYVIKGKIQIDGTEISGSELAILVKNRSIFQITSEMDSQYLILSGLPIEERIIQHGPFVMNTKTEILEAIRDYQMGKMGMLIENQ